MSAGWYEARQRADKLARALRALLDEVDGLEALATVDSTFDAVIESTAHSMRAAVAELLDELHHDLEPAAHGIDAADEWGHPVSPDWITYLLNPSMEDWP